MTGLRVETIGPAVALQDLGRPGFVAQGLTRGGAADRLALYEGAALLGHAPDCAALEMVGMGGIVVAETDTQIAFTGGEMRASINGAPVLWNACHPLPKGARLEMGPALSGTYSYLHVAGGFDVPEVLGGRGAHLSMGIGELITPGTVLPCHPTTPWGSEGLPRDARFDGGALRLVPSMQTEAFAPETRARFTATAFARDPRANRQGMRLQFEGEGFLPQTGLSVVSEIIATGDVQITGDGTPFILLAECQTTGGYPRIGTVLPSDLPRAVQAPAGAALSFTFLTLDAAREAEAKARAVWAGLGKRVTPLVRDPAEMGDLLGYNLISGMSDGKDMP